jgi:hypothetical protein
MLIIHIRIRIRIHTHKKTVPIVLGHASKALGRALLCRKVDPEQMLSS